MVFGGLTNSKDTAYGDEPGACLAKSVGYISSWQSARDQISGEVEVTNFERWKKHIRGPMSTDDVNQIESIPVVSFHKPYDTTTLDRVDGEVTFVMALVHMTDKSFLMFLSSTTGDILSAFDLLYEAGHVRSGLALFQQWVPGMLG
jgi:hypothetical protein